MPLKLRDIRVAMFAVEGSLEAVDKHAAGPLGNIGDYLNYRELFAQASKGENGLDLPWDPDADRANLFWANYVTSRMSANQEQDVLADIAWKAIVPLKAPAALTAGQFHPRLQPAFSEAFVWPTGVGFCRHYCITGDLDPAELGSILAAGQDGQKRHDALNAIRKEVWGDAPAAGAHSELVTVVSVAQVVSASAPEEEDEAALASLLKGLEMDEQPHILGAGAPGTGGVYSADGFRLIWLPKKFRSTRRPIHSVGCFHRNMTVGSLQAQLLATTLLQLDNLRQDGALPARYSSVVDRLRDCISRFWSPFFVAWLEKSKVAKARAALGA